MFPAFLTYILYLSFSNPHKFDKNLRLYKYYIPSLFWILNSIGGIYIYFFTKKRTGDDLVC